MVTIKIGGSSFADDLLNFGDLRLEYNRQEKLITLPALKLKGEARGRVLQIISQRRALDKVPVSVFVGGEEVFSGYLDFTQEHNLSCDDFFVGVHADRIDVLRDLAQGFTIEMLRPEVRKVPTVVSRVPQYTEAALALGITFLLTLSLREQVQKLLEEIGGLSGNPLEWGRIAVLILRVGYIAATVASIIIMLKRFYDFLIGDLNEYSAFSVEDALRKGAQRLGLGFYTDVTFLKELYIMPPQSPSIRQDYEQVAFGDFLQRMADLLSCVIFVQNNTLHFVRKKPPAHCFVKLEKVSEPFEIKINASELFVREELKLAFDESDANTLLLKNYHIQIIRDGLKTQTERVIYSPYVLGRRKDKLTLPEEVLKSALTVFEAIFSGVVVVVNGLISVVNAIIKLINGIIKALRTLGIKVKSNLQPIKPIPKQTFAAKIEERKGALLLENGVVGAPRILTLSGNKLAETQRGVLDFFESFETQAKEGQKRLYSAWAPMCTSDVQRLLLCGGVEVEGKKYTLESLEYSYAEQIAKVTYAEPYTFSNFVVKQNVI